MFDPVTNRMPQVIRLAPAALLTIENEVRLNNDGRETGGILLGQAHQERFEVLVAGDQGPAPVRSPDFFSRDLNHAQGLAEAAWNEHGAQWIGEWHTHPRSALYPSPVDLRTYRRHLLDSELRFDVFIALIARMVRDRVLIAGWAISSTEVRRVDITQ